MAQVMAIWEDAEVSTRNCYNALKTGILVKCRLGFNMKVRHTKTLYKHETVIKAGCLLGWCEGCQFFDNDWNGKNGHQIIDAEGNYG